MILSITISVLIVLISYKIYKRYTLKYINVGGKSILITGCDTGFGNGLAQRLDTLGFYVIATCLDPKGDGAKSLIKTCSKRLNVIGLDVSNDESVKEALKEATHKLNGSKAGLWAVVNNAGIAHFGDVELCPIEMYRKVAEVNLFGMIRVTKAFLPMIRKTKGRVINVTSVKGRFSLPFISVYGITKYGGENFSDTLRMEMKKFGVKVIIIEPGEFGGITGMVLGKSMDRLKRDFDWTWDGLSQEVKDTYGKDYMYTHIKRVAKAGDTTYPNMKPVINAFVDAIMNENPKTRYLVPGSSFWIDRYCFYGRLYPFLPSSWMDYLITRWYAHGMPTVKSLEES